MSQPENARGMDESSRMGRSVNRGQAQAGEPRRVLPSKPEPVMASREPQPLAGAQTREDTIGIAISRPMPGPQWPLAGPIPPPVFPDTVPYRPPPGRSQPPPRPPRPSRVPSILDQSRLQHPFSSFQFTSQDPSAEEFSSLEAQANQYSRSSTHSSLELVPDFPQPMSAPNNASPRRSSLNLGLPPSARRGASSYYSNASFVSPIPEEGSRIKSYASSAVIPAHFRNISPSSHIDPYFDDAVAEDSMFSDDADDSHLVRSASMGKRGKPALVTTKAIERSPSLRQQPSPENTQNSAFVGGAGYNHRSSGSSAQNTVKEAGASSLTTNTMLTAFENASSTNLSRDPQSKPSKLATGRRPPRLDMDAIKAAEARGSLTSLPDLIRRATRLASIMDRGKRPASRLDGLDFSDDIYSRDPEKDGIYEMDRRQSGLSDMLAAFPPPASRHSMRHSLGSWPFPRVATKSSEQRQGSDGSGAAKTRRRCCGLPLWGFLLAIFIVISIIVAAVVVPVELLVVKKADTPDLVQACATQLTCANGGTSVASQGTCSCICSSGFSGRDCTVPTTQGCTTITLDTKDASGNRKVTIGQDIPSLFLDAQANFSVPLIAATIVSRFNSAGLTCNAENALVTFEGQWSDKLDDRGRKVRIGRGIVATVSADIPLHTAGAHPISATTRTVDTPRATSRVEDSGAEPHLAPTTSQKSNVSTRLGSVVTRSSSTNPATPKPTGAFVITEQVVEFARIAVLYILQEKSVAQASEAQSSLQKFLNGVNSGTMANQAQNITIGDGNTINLIDFHIDVGAGTVGRVGKS